MKRVFANLILAIVLGIASMPVLAVDFSANIGYNSHYIYRGIPQEKSSANGGLDLNANGFYLGTWAADVGDGIEIDYYGGYAFDVDDWSFGIGGTVYTYTGDFDDTYKEVNLSVGWKFLTFDAAFGKWDAFDDPSQDYQFYSVTAEYNGLYGKVGWFADDFDGTYIEGGYGSDLTVNDTYLFDYAFSVIYSNSTLLGGESDTNMNFSISRAFDF